jgi:multidrug efflux pump subunit AcrB
MMTALVDCLGPLPTALSTGSARRRSALAIVIIGCALSIARLTRVFQPILMLLLHRCIGLTEEQRKPGPRLRVTRPESI